MSLNIINRLVDINRSAQEDVKARRVIVATTFTLRFLLGLCGNEGGDDLLEEALLLQSCLSATRI